MKYVKAVLGILTFFIAYAISCVLVFYITFYVNNRYSLNLSGVTIQVINSILSLVILGSVFSIIGRVFQHPKHMKMIKEVLHAIRSISRGDYNVSVNLEKFKNVYGGEIGEVIDSFNNMAVNLEKMENMKQEFITNVSHEIQSPLTSIKGFAKVLQNEGLPLEERMQYLNIIEFESNRLSKLSDNLLKLTSLESQNTPLEKSKFSLHSQLMYTILSCEPQILDKEINMKVNLHKVDIVGDEVLLNQVWLNIISNSIKFTPNNGEISISIIEETNKVIVKIQDTGIGILNENQFHIFERFYKADKSRDRNTVGNGLGLSIVKKIVEMHNGTVYVESEVGKGSIFFVELPNTN